MVDISATHPGSSFQVHKDIVFLYPLEVNPGQVIWFVQCNVYRHEVCHFQPQYLTVFDGLSNSVLSLAAEKRTHILTWNCHHSSWNYELTHRYQLLRESPKTTADVQ